MVKINEYGKEAINSKLTINQFASDFELFWKSFITLCMIFSIFYWTFGINQKVIIVLK